MENTKRKKKVSVAMAAVAMIAFSPGADRRIHRPADFYPCGFSAGNPGNGHHCINQWIYQKRTYRISS